MVQDRPPGLIRLRAVTRAWAVLIAAGVLCAGCPSVDPYACSVDTQCVLEGEPGQCRDDRCAYEDAACPSGFRWPDGTDRGLAGMCVPTGETDPSTSSSTGEPTTLSMSSTEPVTTVEPSTSGDGSSTTGEPACTLEPSTPVAFDGESNLVVERLTIDAQSQAGVRITDCPGVIVRDLEVRFAGNAGIAIYGSADATIERVRLVNTAAPEEGAAAASEIAIHVEDSPGVQIRHVLVDDARSGIQVLGSDNAIIEDFVVHNARGELDTGNDSGGDCALVQNSATAIVRRFGCLNDPQGVNAHAGIFIDRSPGALVEEGVANNVISGSDAGVRVHTQDGTGGVTIQYVDVVGGTHACYDSVYSDDVTFFDTGCRNNSGYGWAASQVVGEVRVQQGRYYNLGQGEQCCGDVFTEFDAAPDQFAARLPPDVAAPCSVF